MKSFLFAATIILILHSPHAKADYQEKCEQATKPIKYDYCSLVEPSSRSFNVIFYFHGSGGNAKEASKIFPKYLGYWQSHGLEIPTVISVSFGTNWYLVPKSAFAPSSGLLEVVTDHLMNDLEARILGRTATSRTVVGVSMGGVNAALLSLTDRPHLPIAKVAMLAPGLVDLSPWASDQQISDYAKEYGSDQDLLIHIGKLSQSLVSSEAEWMAISPLVRITTPPQSPLQLFVMGNIEDKNFYHGAERFADEAKKSIPLVDWVPWPGGHSHFVWDDPALPEFLTR
jgi:pimeloyl-ACP methyl ester carboxylesterase